MKQTIFTGILIFALCFAASAQTNEIICPVIKIFGLDSVPEINQAIDYKVEISKEAEKYKVELVWKVKGGEIIGGQGTKVIKVLFNGSESNNVAIQVKGLPPNCSNSASESFVVDDASVWEIQFFAKLGKTTSGEKKATLDLFFGELQNNPSREGFIKLWDNKNLKKDLTWMLWYLNARRFDKTRISFVIVPEIGEQTTLLIAPTTNSMPDCKDCLIFKAEDFDKLKKLFQPKPTVKKHRK